MTTREIDVAILAVAQKSWRKVAMILDKTSEQLGSRLPDGNRGLRIIEQRLTVLVRTGQLIADGDIFDWRRSEVRLAGPLTIERVNGCALNLRRIDGAKQYWAEVNQKSVSDAPTWADLRPYLTRKPVCPKGGVYKLDRVGDVPKCSFGKTHRV